MNHQPPRPAGETPDPVLTALASPQHTGPTRAQVLQVFADTDQGRVPLDASDIARRLDRTWELVRSLLLWASLRGYVEPARYTADAFLITDRGLGYLAALTRANCGRNGHRMRGPFPSPGTCADCGWTDPPLSSVLTVVHGDDAATTATHTSQTTLMLSPTSSAAERTAFLIAARDLFALRLHERRREAWPVRVWLENNSPDDNPTGTLLYTSGDLRSWHPSAVTGQARGLMTFADGSSISDAALVRVTF